jgi:hypothetical protein
MRRLPVFAAVGPFLSWLIFIAILAPQAGPVFEEGGQMYVISLFVTYGITLAPLIAIAYIDRRLAAYPWRVLVCAVAGFAWLTAVHYSFVDGGEEFRQFWFFGALVGGLPAAICSWLGGKYAPDA